MTADQAKVAYADFLADIPQFENALSRVITDWRYSCDQFLSNDQMNRIAWLGQASMCFAHGVPSVFRGGFKLLAAPEQRLANQTADDWLRTWIERRYLSGKKNTEVHNSMAQPRLFD
jgi:hypothetical protein